MTETIFDIESNGLLYEADRIWCVAHTLLDVVWFFRPDEVEESLEWLMNQESIVAHNALGYDIPLIQKLYPWFKPNQVHDTFILSCLFWPDLQKQGGHSLEAWAKRLNLDVQKQAHEDWSQYSPEMGERCKSDVQINKAVWEYMQTELNAHDWSKAIQLEYKMAEIHAQQVLAGVEFDVSKAELLYEEIQGKILEIEDEVKPQLPMRAKQYGVMVKEPFKRNGECKKMVEDWYDGDK